MRYHISAATVRMTATYLATIMLLSVTFSLVFYATSTSGLDQHIQSPGKPTAMHNSSQSSVMAGLSTNGVLTQVTTTSVAQANLELERQVAALRNALAQRLVFMNIGVLLTGALVSVVLARRTLRPIEAALDAQSRFASDASHELRTPLTIMQSELEVALNQANISSAKAKRLLRSAYQEVGRLRQLSENLLRLAQTDRRPSGLSPVALDEATDEAINAVYKLARKRHSRITNITPRLYALADRPSTVQILSILLDNALKHTPAGTAVIVKGSTGGKWVQLEVIDCGPGVASTDLPHIFEPFYRAKTITSGEPQGYGLGLSIANKLAAQQNGTLTATNNPSNGMTFTLRLRAAKL